MTPTWKDETPPPDLRLRGSAQWARALFKGALLALVVFPGLALLLLLRLVERPLHGVHRPWTPSITQAVCRLALAIIGLSVKTEGRPGAGPLALVANHASWLDIFVLNSVTTLYFVAKAEVAGWPGIGWLARATGTVFIRRTRADAVRQRDLFSDRIRAGHRLLFFPEGTSTDSLRVLDFKPTLFAAFFQDEAPAGFSVQPVSVVYTAPKGADPRFYGWWGDMEFGEHLLHVLAAPRHGHVLVVFHQPLAVADHPNRKDLARVSQDAVRSAFVA